MRIALLSYRSKPHCGGQGVYVRHLSRELVGLGHTVEVFSGQPYPELDPGVALTRVPSLDLYREPDPFRTPALREIRDAIDAYKRASDEGRIERKADASGYPPSLAALVDGVTIKSDPENSKMYFLRRIPRDPVSGEEWGLRSYASPASQPQPGKDVYDVYSRGAELGLNRVPYREW